MKTIVLHNGNKGVTNYIMGSNVFIAMNVTYKVDIHRVNRMCAHALKDTYNWKMG